jgi:hypothetical protein
MTLVQAVIIKTMTYSIVYALETTYSILYTLEMTTKTYYNKDFTKNLYTSLYSMSIMNLACGLETVCISRIKGTAQQDTADTKATEPQKTSVSHSS